MAKAFLNKKNFVRKRSTNMTLILNSAYDVILISVLDKVKNSNFTLSSEIARMTGKKSVRLYHGHRLNLRDMLLKIIFK